MSTSWFSVSSSTQHVSSRVAASGQDQRRQAHLRCKWGTCLWRRGSCRQAGRCEGYKRQMRSISQLRLLDGHGQQIDGRCTLQAYGGHHGAEGNGVRAWPRGWSPAYLLCRVRVMVQRFFSLPVHTALSEYRGGMNAGWQTQFIACMFNMLGLLGVPHKHSSV